MQKAQQKDKETIVNILTDSFNDNKSVNYLIKQDAKRVARIKNLMGYAFDICLRFGEVFITEDRKGCALILMPDKKKTTLHTIMLDLKLAVSGIGLANLFKAMKREASIKKQQPKGLLYYIWFIGVDTKEQGNGIGSSLLNEILDRGIHAGRTICLETSTLKNLPWYEKHGFEEYAVLDFGYKLYCMKRG